MLGYWTRFAATGEPNGPGAPLWPAYRSMTDNHLDLGEPIIARAGMRTPQCDFWESLVR